jgi:hypothetical protein
LSGLSGYEIKFENNAVKIVARISNNTHNVIETPQP